MDDATRSRVGTWLLAGVAAFVIVRHLLFVAFDRRELIDHDFYYTRGFEDVYDALGDGRLPPVDVDRPPPQYPPLVTWWLAVLLRITAFSAPMYRLAPLALSLVMVLAVGRARIFGGDALAGAAAAAAVVTMPLVDGMSRQYFYQFHAALFVAVAWTRLLTPALGPRGFDQSGRDVVGAAAATSLALLCHPMAALFLPPLALVAARRLRERAAPPRGLWRVGAGVAAAFAPAAAWHLWHIGKYWTGHGGAPFHHWPFTPLNPVYWRSWYGWNFVAYAGFWRVLYALGLAAFAFNAFFRRGRNEVAARGNRAIAVGYTLAISLVLHGVGIGDRNSTIPLLFPVIALAEIHEAVGGATPARVRARAAVAILVLLVAVWSLRFGVIDPAQWDGDGCYANDTDARSIRPSRTAVETLADFVMRHDTDKGSGVHVRFSSCASNAAPCADCAPAGDALAAEFVTLFRLHGVRLVPDEAADAQITVAALPARSADIPDYAALFAGLGVPPGAPRAMRLDCRGTQPALYVAAWPAP